MCGEGAELGNNLETSSERIKNVFKKKKKKGSLGGPSHSRNQAKRDPMTFSSQEAPAPRGLELEEATRLLAGGLSAKAHRHQFWVRDTEAPPAAGPRGGHCWLQPHSGGTHSPGALT